MCVNRLVFSLGIFDICLDWYFVSRKGVLYFRVRVRVRGRLVILGEGGGGVVRLGAG